MKSQECIIFSGRWHFLITTDSSRTIWTIQGQWGKYLSNYPFFLMIQKHYFCFSFLQSTHYQSKPLFCQSSSVLHPIKIINMERKLIKSRLNSSSLIFSCIQFRAWAICVRLKIEDNAPDCSVDVEDERLWLYLSKKFQYTGVNKDSYHKASPLPS